MVKAIAKENAVIELKQHNGNFKKTIKVSDLENIQLYKPKIANKPFDIYNEYFILSILFVLCTLSIGAIVEYLKLRQFKKISAILHSDND